MKNILSIGFFSLVLVLAACEMPTGGDSDDASSSSISSVVTSSSTSESSESGAGESSESSKDSASSTSSPSAKRTIEISADNWAFSPSAVTAKKGEVLEIRLTGVAGTHGFAIPELGINLTVAAGEVVTVTIPTDTEGTFSFFCSIPCGSGHRDMKGTITISA